MTDKTTADHYTVGDLLKTAEELIAKAAATGGGGTALATYPNHHTILAYRKTDGTPEIHLNYADIFYIVRGKATLLTEGTLAGAKEESPGELRGTGVEGGKKTELNAGDVVHIPAGTPHHLRIGSSDELLYFVIKVKES